jgi:acetyl esterase
MWDPSLPSFTENATAPILDVKAAAGVPVEVHNAETMVHGYLGYADVVPAATAGLDRGLAALRNALSR